MLVISSWYHALEQGLVLSVVCSSTGILMPVVKSSTLGPIHQQKPKFPQNLEAVVDEDDVDYDDQEEDVPTVD